MSSMKEMAAEYREAAAKLSMKIAEKETAGADPQEISALRNIRNDIRALAFILDGYYDVPRPAGNAVAVDWKARRIHE